MQKKLLSLLLVLSMLIALTAPALANEPFGATGYQDAQGHWAEQAIETWSDYGVVQGGDGKFRPDAPITRGEQAVVLARLLGLTEKADNHFIDLDENWYTDSVLQCVAAGIIKGSCGNIRPNDPITRQESMVMLGRALAIPEQSDGAVTFEDEGQVSDWARGYVNALVSKNIVGGIGNNRLAPEDSINRASMVTILDHAISTYANADGSVLNITAEQDGMVLIVASDVTIKGAISGDLLVAAGAADSKLNLLGVSEIGTVTLDTSNIVLTVSDSSHVDSVQLTSNASGSAVHVGTDSSITQVVTTASDTKVTGPGIVGTVTATSGAVNTKVDNKGTTVVAQVGATGTVAGGKTVTPGGSTTISSTTAQNSSGGSSSGGGTMSISVTFDANGGSNVKAQTIISGSKAVRPTDPTREGYTFVGWFSGENAYDFDTAVTGALTLVARWNVDSSYSITFNSNGGSEVASIIANYGSRVTEPINPTKTGYTFNGWYGDKELNTPFTFSTMPLNGAELHAKWTVNPYTITFHTNGGDEVAAITQDYGTTVTKPVNPIKESHIFMGWYSDQELKNPYIFTTMPVNGADVYAKWQGAYATLTGTTSVTQWDVNQNGISMTLKLDPGYTFDQDYIALHKDKLVDGITFYGQLFDKTKLEYYKVPMEQFVTSGLNAYRSSGYFSYLDVGNSVTVYDRFVGLNPKGEKSTATAVGEDLATLQNQYPGVQKGIRDALKAGGTFVVSQDGSELTIACTASAAEGYFAQFDNSVPVCNGGIQISCCDVNMTMELPAGTITNIQENSILKGESYFSIQEMKIHAEVWEYVTATEALETDGTTLKNGYFTFNSKIQGTDQNTTSTPYSETYYLKPVEGNILNEADIRATGTNGPNGTGDKLIKIVVDTRVGPSQWASTKNMSTFLTNLFRTNKDATGYSGGSSDTYTPADDAQWLKVENKIMKSTTMENNYAVQYNPYIINYSGNHRNDVADPAEMWMFYELPPVADFNIDSDMTIYLNLIAGMYGGSGQSAVNGQPVSGMDGRYSFVISATDDSDLTP